MLGEPEILACCDRCGCDSEPLGMTATVGGGWDDRNVEGELKRWGWRIEGDKTYCPDCREADGGGKRMSEA